MNARKGIVLAGGSGTRLYPATLAGSKQLLPVYDKPMIYYPLSTLMLAGLRSILIITTPQEAPRFQQLLGDGARWGLELHYAVQPEPAGIAQALTIAEPFLAGAASALILGDNLFYGHDLQALLTRAAGRAEGATIFAAPVHDPARYGVVTLDAQGRPTAIEEKPRTPRSPYAVTGLYFYDAQAPQRVRGLRPSARGELEITDLNTAYLASGALHVEILPRGYAWLDAGTHQSLLDASQFIATLQQRQGLKVACPEEIAWRRHWIGDAQLRQLAEPLRSSGYGDYLLRLLREAERAP